MSRQILKKTFRGLRKPRLILSKLLQILMNVQRLQAVVHQLAGRVVHVLIHKSGLLGPDWQDKLGQTACKTLIKGSFSCRCDPGYVEGVDRDSCIDIDECNDGTHLCSEYGYGVAHSKMTR